VKVLKTLATWAVVIVLVVLWHRYLVSSRPPKLKAWEACKTKILDNWAASHSDKAEGLRYFTHDHVYSFAAASSSEHFDDHDSRGLAVSDAVKLGVTEAELVQVDQRIAEQCGPFPRE
jgi:hypothetical protein